VTSSIQALEGVTLVQPPRPGTGPNHETLTIVEMVDEARLSSLVRAIEDAPTSYRPEIVPGVVTLVTGKLKPDTTPEAIMKALTDANLLEE
jgi:hypothetical protein